MMWFFLLAPFIYKSAALDDSMEPFKPKGERENRNGKGLHNLKRKRDERERACR